MNPKKEQILSLIKQSIEQKSMHRLTISKNRSKNAEITKVVIQLVEVKTNLQCKFVYRLKTKDITKIHDIKNSLELIGKMLIDEFMIANLFTSEGDYVWEVNKKYKVRLRESKASNPNPPNYSHDKVKTRKSKSTGYLIKLGILNASGNVQKDKGDKYKQIQNYVEILDHQIKKNKVLSQKSSISVVDMGSGKGYLTFALYDYLTHTKGVQAQVKGIEIRPDLVKKCNDLSQSLDYTGLSFEIGYISEFSVPNTDILIALHACDTATDDAIAKGIKAGAELIVCAPCCHRQIRKELNPIDPLTNITSHGILKERQAEILTDTMRALLMESRGYRTKIIEFISSEHTGKNLMLIGHKTNSRDENALNKLEQLKSNFGIHNHYLESIL